MKIVLDLTIIRDKNKITGIERVAIESVRGILENEIKKDNEFYILTSKLGKEVVLEEFNYILNGDVKIYSSPIQNRIYTDQIWSPLIINKIKPSFVYYTTLGLPLINNFPFYMIIHDAVAWEMPETISAGMKYYYKPLIQRAVKHKKLNKIMTVSNFSKNEIVKHLNIEDSKIFVNYLGISKEISLNNILDSNLVKNQYAIEGDYIIALGTLEPRKNIEGLITAYTKLKEKYGIEEKLVIVGRKGWSDSFEINPKVKDEIIFTGYVSNDHLSSLLLYSKLFVFPSYYEGFGLPLIEAMSLGVPVLSSNKASLPEIGGEACQYFNPYDIDEFTDSLYQLLTNNKKLKELSELGKNRVEQFTWKQHTEKLKNVFYR